MWRIEYRLNFQHLQPVKKSARRGAVAQPGCILGGSDKFQARLAGSCFEIGQFVVGIDVMIRKWPLDADRPARCSHGVEELFRVADTGESQKLASGQRSRIYRLDTRREYGLAGTRRTAHQRIGRSPLTHLQDGVRMQKLVANGRP